MLQITLKQRRGPFVTAHLVTATASTAASLRGSERSWHTQHSSVWLSLRQRSVVKQYVAPTQARNVTHVTCHMCHGDPGDRWFHPPAARLCAMAASLAVVLRTTLPPCHCVLHACDIARGWAAALTHIYLPFTPCLVDSTSCIEGRMPCSVPECSMQRALTCWYASLLLPQGLMQNYLQHSWEL